MKVDVYSLDGSKLTEKIELSEKIFGAEPNKDLLAQYVDLYLENQRQGNAATKTRGMVAGGGRKPWRQKGTGRARHGSIRSPLWVGGGVTHGPQPKVWESNLPRTMRRSALFTSLSLRQAEGGVVIIDNLPQERIKTKELVKILQKLPVKDKIVIGLTKLTLPLRFSSRNIAGVESTCINNLNAFNVLNTKFVLLTRDSLKDLENLYHE